MIDPECEDWCEFAPIEQCPSPQSQEEKMDKAVKNMIYKENMTDEQHEKLLKTQRDIYANMSKEDKKKHNIQSYEADKLRLENDPVYKQKRQDYTIAWQKKEYNENPEFREKRKAYGRKSYRKKVAAQQS